MAIVRNKYKTLFGDRFYFIDEVLNSLELSLECDRYLSKLDEELSGLSLNCPNCHSDVCHGKNLSNSINGHCPNLPSRRQMDSSTEDHQAPVQAQLNYEIKLKLNGPFLLQVWKLEELYRAKSFTHFFNSARPLMESYYYALHQVKIKNGSLGSNREDISLNSISSSHGIPALAQIEIQTTISNEQELNEIEKRIIENSSLEAKSLYDRIFSDDPR